MLAGPAGTSLPAPGLLDGAEAPDGARAGGFLAMEDCECSERCFPLWPDSQNLPARQGRPGGRWDTGTLPPAKTPRTVQGLETAPLTPCQRELVLTASLPGRSAPGEGLGLLFSRTPSLRDRPPGFVSHTSTLCRWRLVPPHGPRGRICCLAAALRGVCLLPHTRVRVHAAP